VASGALLPVMAAVFWRRVTVLDREPSPFASELELLRAVPMFAVLPEPTLEQLAGKLDRVRHRRGQTVFSQGDTGDRFYVIAEGTAEVSIDGKIVSVLGPGDYFGEIALIRDVPRTAGVTTTSDSDLYALERDDFIAAVTGHAQSVEAADAVIATRLRWLGPTGTA
jgi:CRP-like cAMP-binding protein